MHPSSNNVVVENDVVVMGYVALATGALVVHMGMMECTYENCWQVGSDVYAQIKKAVAMRIRMKYC